MIFSYFNTAYVFTTYETIISYVKNLFMCLAIIFKTKMQNKANILHIIMFSFLNYLHLMMYYKFLTVIFLTVHHKKKFKGDKFEI